MNWNIMCGSRSSILHYGPLKETNNLCTLTPNVQKSECVVNKRITPLPFIVVFWR